MKLNKKKLNTAIFKIRSAKNKWEYEERLEDVFNEVKNDPDKALEFYEKDLEKYCNTSNHLNH